MSKTRTLLLYILVSGITFCISAFAAGMYVRSSLQVGFDDYLSSVHSRIDSYSTYVRILSVDGAQRAVVAELWSAAVNENIPTLFFLAPDFVIERRDGIMKDGAIVGMTPKKSAALSELQIGMRGFARIHVTPEGRMVLQYLLVGDPLPRP